MRVAAVEYAAFFVLLVITVVAFSDFWNGNLELVFNDRAFNLTP
jgi:hypothetical protein